MTETIDYDVAVVGFGPSGALAANLLGAAGIRTICLDRQSEVYDKPRAIALDHEIMRLFDNIGIAEQVAPYIAPFDLSEHFGADGRLLRRVGMIGEPYPLGYTPTMVFTQPPVERILRKAAEDRATVDIRLGQGLVYLAQRPDHVDVGMRSENGEQHTLKARYVIGCDGASSTVRALTGISLEDLEFDEPWVVADFLVNEAALSKLPANSAHFCEPSRPIALVNGPGNHRRWEIMLLEDEDPAEMRQPEKVWELVARWLSPSDAELWRAASYRFHALVAEEWSSGRVFLAGDAAHQQPPILGQGMCQGMRDVANLCWRLADVINGAAPPDILDAYGLERGTHVRELTNRIKTIGAVLCERDPVAARLRDEQMLQASGGKAQTTTRQSVIPPIAAGSLSINMNPGRGQLFPQPEVLCDRATGETALLDRVIGAGWRLIVDGHGQTAETLAELGLAAEASRVTFAALVSAGGPSPTDAVIGVRTLVETGSVMSQWFATHGCSAAVVRPDHYVFGVGGSSDAIAMLDELRGLRGLQPRSPSAGDRKQVDPPVPA